MRMVRKFWSATALSIFCSIGSSCGAVGVDRHANDDTILTDNCGNVTIFYGIPIGLTVRGLKSLPFSVKIGRQMGEGGTYTTAVIIAKQSIEAKAEFDSNRKLELLSTNSHNAVDHKGIRPGSSLVDVETAWPNGKLYYGIADGRYVRYITNTNVVYNLNPNDLNPQAFRGGKEVAVPNLRVQSIEIRSAPIPVAGSGPECSPIQKLR